MLNEQREKAAPFDVTGEATLGINIDTPTTLTVDKGSPYNAKGTSRRGALKLVGSIIAAATVATSVTWKLKSLSGDKASQLPLIDFKDPLQGGLAKMKQQFVQGIITPVPKNSALWLILLNPFGQRFPYRASVRANGTFERYIDIGEPKDSRMVFFFTGILLPTSKMLREAWPLEEILKVPEIGFISFTRE
jgi:hypothetical protein